MAFGQDPKFMTGTAASQAYIDVGLRNYMLRVYNYMALGVAFTGIIALLVASTQSLLEAVALGPLKWVFFIAILGLGWFAPRVMMTGSMGAAQLCFWTYAGAWGALIAPMFVLYTGDSMVRVFFITSAAFAGLSLYGYTTKRNLAPLGAFFAMATIGILIALLVNMFLIQSSGFHMIMSFVVVLIFAGLTAYETQMIKNMYYEADSGNVVTRKAIFGAFMLYGTFVTLFVWLMQIFGVARGE